MSTITIIQGNSNDKDNTRAYMVKGQDGVSPTLSSSREGTTTTVTMTDYDGTHTFDVEDGVSPTVEISKTDGVTTIEITDAEGTHTATIDDGQTYEVPTNSVIGWDSNGAIPAGYEEVSGTYAIGMPVGAITQFAGSVAPIGYLICDGTAVSRTTYSDLFTTIGTIYGDGDGSTTFNLPNLKGKIPVGQDTTQTEFDTLGETGGEKTHTLSINEMPTHNHDSGLGGGGTTSGYGLNYAYSNEYRYYDGTDIIGEEGGGQAHNNLQPYIVLNYIIKY